jgi:hypothetical protein
VAAAPAGVPERPGRSDVADRVLARHEVPEVDAAALTAARAVDRLLLEARQLSMDGTRADAEGLHSFDAAHRAAAAERWTAYFGRLPDQLRDDPLPQLRSAARRARAAFGPKDSVRDTFGPDVTEPLLDAIDRLLKVIARREANPG